MKAQHTPGPWTVDPEGRIAVTIEGGNGEPICDVYGANKEADAYLIAAAPAMLESIKSLYSSLAWHVDNHGHFGMDMARLEEALGIIFKASKP